MFNNDERYWDIGLLNKWFAISSIIFLAVTIWVFVDDNDDEFKDYQREFRKMEVEIAKKKLLDRAAEIEVEKTGYEEDLARAQKEFDSRKEELALLDDKLNDLKDLHYDQNMLYQSHKAEVEALKYLVETDNVSGGGPSYRDEYYSALDKLDKLRLNKEKSEIEISAIESEIKSIKLDVKQKKDALARFTKDYNLAKNKLNKLDRDQMTLANKLGDIVRDLPILDFLDPYYKVNQIVVADIKYDVNFASVPVVDRCTSCHLGIDNPDYVDAPQPYTTHPNLDLYLTSSSPHPINNFGCTSCHSGRSRGTSFVSSSHTPNTPEDKERWMEEHDWKVNHHWLTPMLPTRYTEASCFNCHSNTSDLVGGEKINLGLSLIDKAGCNGCHHNENWPSLEKAGPNLKHINEKLTEDWVAKWVKNPRHFRYNTRMPAIFEQPNQESPEVSDYNDVEIAGITKYLFDGKNKDIGNDSKRYIGDPENGPEKLFSAVGCMGCHISESNPEEAPHINNYKNLTKVQGPNLVGLGSKVSAEWLYEWLMDPLAYNPETKMPNLRLDPEQAKDITAYLLQNKNEEFDAIPAHAYKDSVLEKLTVNWLKKSNPESFALAKAEQMSTDEKLNFIGEKSIRHYGCFGCHSIDGFDDAKPIGVEITEEGSKPVGKFDFGLFHDIEHSVPAWIENKLRTPRIYDRGKESQHLDLLKMPNFYFSEEEIEAITTAVLAFNSNKVGEKLVASNNDPDIYKEGHRLVKQYNCQGCHLIENRGGQLVEQMGQPEYAPPNLNSEGRKANPDWLLSFFNNPSIIRPNLQVKMPSFHQISDKEWDAIIAYFKHADGETVNYRSAHQFDIAGNKFEAGEKIHELGQCNSCHFYGKVFPTGDAPTWAPNLALTKERLNPEWVTEWLKNPQAIMPGTKMPAPYIPDSEILSMEGAEDDWGSALVALDGDTTDMLNGLRDYLWNIKGDVNIDALIKNYFLENGYDFDNIGSDDEYDDEEDDWGDDEEDDWGDDEEDDWK